MGAEENPLTGFGIESRDVIPELGHFPLSPDGEGVDGCLVRAQIQLDEEPLFHCAMRFRAGNSRSEFTLPHQVTIRAIPVKLRPVATATRWENHERNDNGRGQAPSSS
jgi:hypothetical protein